MTKEEIEKKHEEHVEILKALEQLVITQQTTFKVHNDRLTALRELYVALSELKDLKLAAEEASTPAESKSE